MPGSLTIQQLYLTKPMESWINTINQLITQSRQNLWLAGICIGILWVVHILNVMSGMRLCAFGILPRKRWGLIGIFTSPFIHGHFEHLFFNSIATFILVDLMLIAGIPTFVTATIIIILITGALVWLLGRPALHIGASGVMLGYWSYLLVNAIVSGSNMAWLLGLLCFYYLGGLGLSLIPNEPGTSWEAHIFGAFAGVAAVYLTPFFLAHAIF